MLRECISAKKRGIHFGQGACLENIRGVQKESVMSKQAASAKTCDVTKYIRSKGAPISNYNFARYFNKGQKTIKALYGSGNFQELDALIERYKQENNIEKSH
jgi:hypothetical protein